MTIEQQIDRIEQRNRALDRRLRGVGLTAEVMARLPAPTRRHNARDVELARRRIEQQLHAAEPRRRGASAVPQTSNVERLRA